MSKIKVGKFKESCQEVVFSESVENLIDIFREDMKFRRVTYNIAVDKTLVDNMVKVDEQRLNIVLYNLISNSVKNTQQGLIVIQARIIY